MNTPNPKVRADSASGSSLVFDTGAARAQKEAASQRDFARWKADSSQTAAARDLSGAPAARTDNRGGSYSGSYRPPFQETRTAYQTRPVRIEHVFSPYYSRPVVVYHDPYSSFFWWWLLDRSLEDRAYWAYHHRYDMDAARYQALMASEAALQQRVSQLEAQQVAVNPNYTPPGLAPDLMYQDQYVHRVYRAQAGGRFLFWLVMVPTTIAIVWFLGWLIFIKRWYSS